MAVRCRCVEVGLGASHFQAGIQTTPRNVRDSEGNCQKIDLTILWFCVCTLTLILAFDGFAWSLLLCSGASPLR